MKNSIYLIEFKKGKQFVHLNLNKYNEGKRKDCQIDYTVKICYVNIL